MICKYDDWKCSSVITFLSTQVNASQAVTKEKFNKVVDSLCVSAVFLQRREAATLAEWKQTHLSASCHPWHHGPLSPAQDGSSQRNRRFGGLQTSMEPKHLIWQHIVQDKKGI